MKTVSLQFKGGIFQASEHQVPDGPTQPKIIVPTPGRFSAGGFATHDLVFDWVQWDDELKQDVYMFAGILPLPTDPEPRSKSRRTRIKESRAKRNRKRFYKAGRSRRGNDRDQR